MNPIGAPDRIAAADAYLEARTGHYEWRCARYDAALAVMYEIGLGDTCTVFDVGSGWGEFGVRMHTLPFAPSRARYVPVDAAIDGTDLEEWIPPRRADYFVALEVVEHLADPEALLLRMMGYADRGVIISTPNPETTDVLGMDATHKTVVPRGLLEGLGFEVTTRSFYGQNHDSLLGVYRARGRG